MIHSLTHIAGAAPTLLVLRDSVAVAGLKADGPFTGQKAPSVSAPPVLIGSEEECSR